MRLETSGLPETIFVLPESFKILDCRLCEAPKHLYFDTGYWNRIARDVDSSRSDSALWSDKPCACTLAVVDCLLFTAELREVGRFHI